jgi:hypothetical protein
LKPIEVDKPILYFSCSQTMPFVIGPIAGSLAEKLGPRVVH